MKKLIFFHLSILWNYFTITKQHKQCIDYIKDYYSDFKTRYDRPGGYFTVTDNYKVELLKSIFTISFDTYKYKEFVKTETIQFDLKNVTSIYPNGTEILENFGNKIGDYQMILTLICGKLAFLCQSLTSVDRFMLI